MVNRYQNSPTAPLSKTRRLSNDTKEVAESSIYTPDTVNYIKASARKLGAKNKARR